MWIRTTTRRTARPRRFEIDVDHFLAQGLVFAGLGQYAGGLMYHDSSLYGKHGTLTAMVPSEDWVWSPELNRFALDYDGTGDNVSLPPIALGSSCTFSAWYSIRNFLQHNPIFSIRTTSGLLQLFDVYHDYFSTTRSSWFGWYNNGNDDRYNWLSHTLTVSTWYHIAVVVAGTTTTVYSNAVAVAAPKATNAQWDTSGTSAFIGFDDVGDYSLNGLLSDVLIYNRALSPAEIQQLADPSNVMLSGLIK